MLKLILTLLAMVADSRGALGPFRMRRATPARWASGPAPRKRGAFSTPQFSPVAGWAMVDAPCPRISRHAAAAALAEEVSITIFAPPNRGGGPMGATPDRGARVADRHMTYLTRSRLMGFPDYTTVLIEKNRRATGSMLDRALPAPRFAIPTWAQTPRAAGAMGGRPLPTKAATSVSAWAVRSQHDADRQKTPKPKIRGSLIAICAGDGVNKPPHPPARPAPQTGSYGAGSPEKPLFLRNRDRQGSRPGRGRPEFDKPQGRHRYGQRTRTVLCHGTTQPHRAGCKWSIRTPTGPPG